MPTTRFCLSAIWLLCVACSKEPPAAPLDASAAPSHDVPEVAIAQACAAACMGQGSKVQVLRDANEHPQRLYAAGTACHHPPGFYFDMQGVVTETIAGMVVVKGSVEQEQIARRHEDQQRGLHWGEPIACP